MGRPVVRGAGELGRVGGGAKGKGEGGGYCAVLYVRGVSVG